MRIAYAFFAGGFCAAIRPLLLSGFHISSLETVIGHISTQAQFLYMEPDVQLGPRLKRQCLLCTRVACLVVGWRGLKSIVKRACRELYLKSAISPTEVCCISYPSKMSHLPWSLNRWAKRGLKRFASSRNVSGQS